jgi:hypothetical protein
MHTKQIGLFLSIAVCALFVGAHSKGLISSPDKTLNEEPASEELGVESAWPHLRNDFTL